MLDYVVSIFSHQCFVIIGGICSILFFISILCVVYQILSGTLPVLYKIGKGLSNRTMAVFAENEFENLKDLLCDADLFKSKNIKRG